MTPTDIIYNALVDAYWSSRSNTLAMTKAVLNATGNEHIPLHYRLAIVRHIENHLHERPNFVKLAEEIGTMLPLLPPLQEPEARCEGPRSDAPLNTDANYWKTRYVLCNGLAKELVEVCLKAKKHLEPDLAESGSTVFWELVAALVKAKAAGVA